MTKGQDLIDLKIINEVRDPELLDIHIIQPTKIVVAAIHNWQRDGDKDGIAHRIFEKYGAEHYYQETCYARDVSNPRHMERDIGYYVAPTCVERLRNELCQAGFIVRIGDTEGERR